MVKKITEIMKEQPEQKAIVQKYELRKMTSEEIKKDIEQTIKEIEYTAMRYMTPEQIKKWQAQQQSDHKGV